MFFYREINKDLGFQYWLLKLIQPLLNKVKQNELSYALINIMLCWIDKYSCSFLLHHRFKSVKLASTVREHELKIKTVRSHAKHSHFLIPFSAQNKTDKPLDTF